MNLFNFLIVSSGVFLGFNPSNSINAVVDDCSFIREQLALLPPEGGTVLIPSGTYTCSAPIIMDRDHQTLRGQGAVTLRLADNINAPLVVMGELATPPRLIHDVNVLDLNIDGNRKYQRQECWGGPCDSGGTSNIRNNGITVRGIIDGRIQNVAITGPRSGGVVTEKGCDHLIVDGLTVTDSEFDGFAGYLTTNSIFTNMDLSHNANAGISIDIGFHKNIIRNTRITFNRDVGIFMRDSNSNLFDNVDIEDSGNHGIFVAQVDDNSTCPTDNEFHDLTVVRSQGAGFRLNNACVQNRLTGTAVFRQNRDHCISEGTATPLLIKGDLQCDN